MKGNSFIQSLRLFGFLSFSWDLVSLQPLNVLIGPNGSGKSNFIEAFRILNSAPEDIGKPIREGGGIGEFICKKEELFSFDIQAEVNWETDNNLLLYDICLANNNSRLVVSDEYIQLLSHQDKDAIPEYLYKFDENEERAVIYAGQLILPPGANAKPITNYVSNDIKVQGDRSILSQIKDPSRYSAIAHLQEIFSEIHFYTGWNLGRYGALRYPQKADLPSNRLLEDGSNLGLVLINKPYSLRQEITERLKVVLPTIEEIFPKVEGGTVPLYVREKGFSTPTPATRLSEGTLRYLCLLTLLLDPTPPPIICLEEPEAGLHPHVVSQIAELLIDASQRTQLIVTTHSDALISGLTDCPEAILICERDDEGTKLRRLEAEQIKPWLDRYAIGDLWRMGEIGGVR